MNVAVESLDKIVVLHDNILVKTKPKELVTLSGIILCGAEDDYLTGEVLAVNESYLDEDEKKVMKVPLKKGDFILFEKNFHTTYTIESRNRIDHTFKVAADKDYEYVLTCLKDVYCKILDEKAKEALITGELFPLTPKKVKRLSV